MVKVYTLRNIMALSSVLFLLSCKNESDEFISGQWEVQSVSSEDAYVPNMDGRNYSLNVSQSSGDGSSVYVTDGSGEIDEAAIRYKSGNRMIVEYFDPASGEKVLVQMEKN